MYRGARKFQGDAGPYWMKATQNANCSECLEAIASGEWIVYYPVHMEALGSKCGCAKAFGKTDRWGPK